jgi:ADP-ribose pyrophosphatase YjhB (NUDIX family)
MTETTAEEVPRRKPVMRWLLQKRWRMSRGMTLGGQACVIDSAGRFLLIRHGYRPGWHFPGGGVEMGENVRDAAVRELEEEAGLAAREVPVLHGIFNNMAAFSGDHIVLYVVRTYERVRTPKPSFEIAEQGFFAADQLPVDTTGGTRRRIVELTTNAGPSQIW